MTIFILSILYLFSIPTVPFHPDESTFIYMSSDFELVFTDIQAVFWQPGKETDLRQHYRELDAPLGRDLIAIARLIFQVPPITNDWDWSKTWEENQLAGALPDSSTLTVSRLSVAILFPITLILLYLIGKQAHNRLTGWLVVLLYSSNALVLLHTRRAMSESPLLFFEILTVFVLLKSGSRPWLSAFPLALAINAKQSNLVLIVAGLFLIFWCFFNYGKKIRFLFKNLVFFFIILGFTHYLLNPFLWKNPLEGVRVSVAARQELVQQQVDALRSVAPDQVLDTLPKRAISMVYHLFYARPAIADIGNYRTQTAAAETEYFTSPLSNLFRDTVSATLLFILTIFGFFLALYLILWKPGDNHLGLILLLLCTLLQAGVLIFIPLPFQRYVAPLIPFTCLWCAFGISKIVSMVWKRKGAAVTAPNE
jgi:4-amino-4-deoxy-L-arabinose transferase-like glycosyltransferase